MFDLIVDGKHGRALREAGPGSKIASALVHVTVVTAIIVVPLLHVTHLLPPEQTIMAFVAAVPAPPPPPPPPPAPGTPKPAEKTVAADATKPDNPNAAPIEAPSDITPEVARVADRGVEGGVEGGLEGGVLGGIVGGLPAAAPPPPPPPPAPAPRAPVRIGGQITAPALVKRIEPIYPEIAAQAQLTGIVILEAGVGTDGCVETVKVLRSVHPFLDKAAVDALKQWEYSPLVLNGARTPFVLTVTFTFSVARK